jgi:hypothetical protein
MMVINEWFTFCWQMYKQIEKHQNFSLVFFLKTIMSRKNRANAMWFRKECFFVTRRVAVRETTSYS